MMCVISVNGSIGNLAEGIWGFPDGEMILDAKGVPMMAQKKATGGKKAAGGKKSSKKK